MSFKGRESYQDGYNNRGSGWTQKSFGDLQHYMKGEEDRAGRVAAGVPSSAADSGAGALFLLGELCFVQFGFFKSVCSLSASTNYCGQYFGFIASLNNYLGWSTYVTFAAVFVAQSFLLIWLCFKSRILNWIVCLLALWFAGTLFFDAGGFQQSYSYLGFWFAGFCVILGGHSFLSSAAAHN